MKYLWNTEKRRFIDENGHVVRESIIRRWIDDALALVALEFINRADALRGDFTQENFAKWRDLTGNDIASLHYVMTALAFGGFEQMTFDTWNEAERNITNQNNFWNNFTAGVFTGAVALDGKFTTRAGMYAQAGYATYENARFLRELRAGMDEERSIAAGDKRMCATCRRENEMGWSAIGSLVRIGNRECLTACRCYFIYRKKPAAQV